MWRDYAKETEVEPLEIFVDLPPTGTDGEPDGISQPSPSNPQPQDEHVSATALFGGLIDRRHRDPMRRHLPGFGD
jgi:hypothetical protein